MILAFYALAAALTLVGVGVVYELNAGALLALLVTQSAVYWTLVVLVYRVVTREEGGQCK